MQQYAVKLNVTSAGPPCSARQEEIAALSGPDEFGEFYHRLRQIKDYHRKNPNEIEEPMQMEFLRMENERQKPSEEMQSELNVLWETSKGHFFVDCSRKICQLP